MDASTRYLLEVTAPGVYTVEEFGQLFPSDAELKFKVVGENRMVTVVAGHVDDDLARMKDGGSKIDIQCTPIIPYEPFSRGCLGVTQDEVEMKGPTPPFDPTKETFWVRFNVGYQGRSHGELIKVWHDWAVVALNLIHGGQVAVTLYKSVFTREVHLFIQQDGAALNGLAFHLPIMTALGDQVKTTVKALTPITPDSVGEVQAANLSYCCNISYLFENFEQIMSTAHKNLE